jgi:hypothetical protein
MVPIDNHGIISPCSHAVIPWIRCHDMNVLTGVGSLLQAQTALKSLPATSAVQILRPDTKVQNTTRIQQIQHDTATAATVSNSAATVSNCLQTVCKL